MGCTPQAKPPVAVPPETKEPTPPAVLKTPEGLVLTKEGIDFADHKCLGSYVSKVSDRSYDELHRLTGYKLETTCNMTGEVHTLLYSQITYNRRGQRNGYQLQISCNKSGQSFTISVSDIVYDSNWEVIKYKAALDGKVYQFNRQE